MKIINIWGSPECGKSTLAAKIAAFYARIRRQNTILLSPSLDLPALPFYFPNKETNNSLKKIMDNSDISQNIILQNSVIADERLPLIVIGYSLFDNAYSCGLYNQTKWMKLITQLSQMAEYLIIDIPTSLVNNPIAEASFAMADTFVELYSGNFKSIIYNGSANSIFRKFGLDEQRNIKAIRCDVKSKKQCINDISKSEKIDYIIPFSDLVDRQFSAGDLFQKSGDANYEKSILNLVNKIESKNNMNKINSII